MYKKDEFRKPFYRKWWLWLISVVFIIVIVAPEEETSKDKSVITSSEVKKTVAKTATENIDEKPKKLSLEEESKKFIDENLEGKTITDFNDAIIKLDNKELESMIILGHKDGQQFIDDFDLLGRKTTATGKVMDFVELSFNTYNDRGKKSGSKTFTRDDKFYIYMGDKDIENYSFIEYDNLIHKDRDLNEFFLGVYPEEVINFAMIDLDEDSNLSIGDSISIEGIINNYVLERENKDSTKIKKFHLSIDNAHIVNKNN